MDDQPKFIDCETLVCESPEAIAVRAMREIEAHARATIEQARDVRVELAVSSRTTNLGAVEEQPPDWQVDCWRGSFNLHFTGYGKTYESALRDCIHRISEGKHA